MFAIRNTKNDNYWLIRSHQRQTITKALVKVKEKEGEVASGKLLQVLVLLVLSSSWPATNIASLATRQGTCQTVDSLMNVNIRSKWGDKLACVQRKSTFRSHHGQSRRWRWWTRPQRGAAAPLPQGLVSCQAPQGRGCRLPPSPCSKYDPKDSIFLSLFTALFLPPLAKVHS